MSNVKLARCTLARVGLARVFGNRWACACGAVGAANSPESAQESVDAHREKGRRNMWEIPRGHDL